MCSKHSPQCRIISARDRALSIVASVAANSFQEYESAREFSPRFPDPPRVVKGNFYRTETARGNESLFSTSVIIKFVALLRVISEGREIRCAGTLIIPLIKTAGRRGGKRNRDRHHSEKSFSGKEFLQPCLLRYLDGCFVQETGGRSGENIKAPSEGN